MVKNLHQDQISFCSSYSLCWAGTLAQGSNSRRRQGSPHRCCRSQENLSTQLCWRVRKLFSWRLLEKRPQQPHQTASIQLEPEQVKMLDEATKHIREAIMLGRTDIIKKLLEEVWCSLSEAKGKSKVLSNKVLWWPLFYEIESEILAGLGRLSRFELMTFLCFWWLCILSCIYNQFVASIHQNIHGLQIFCFSEILLIFCFCILDFFIEIMQPFLKLEQILNASQNVFHRIIFIK